MHIRRLARPARAHGVWLAAAWLALAAPARAQQQDVDELIRAHVEELARPACSSSRA